jgi:hypothetical protein
LVTTLIDATEPHTRFVIAVHIKVIFVTFQTKVQRNQNRVNHDGTENEVFSLEHFGVFYSMVDYQMRHWLAREVLNVLIKFMRKEKGKMKFVD